ncbi:MAG: ATP-dependent DNA helicase, partial [Gammaproteobacteria bacterium]|nr:ATP-dependent DNA helicase [Gammaproteobacteria bacterium]
WDSPFDYPGNALAYFPELDAEPNQPAYTGAVVAAALPVLRASEGRAFVLFTSYRALREAAERLRADHAGEFEFLVQGDRSRPELLRRFESTPRAVLLGTASFWEGIDVRGPDLSCVVIDKLPFAQPDDPVLKARLARITERGGNAFMELQVPEAVLMLKQGAGRLIRDVDDRGVLMICDPRLARRSYGRIFLKALPPMRRTAALEEVQAFFASPGPPRSG